MAAKAACLAPITPHQEAQGPPDPPYIHLTISMLTAYYGYAIYRGIMPQGGATVEQAAEVLRGNGVAMT